MTIKVQKRNGSSEPLNIEKIHRVVSWGAEGLDNVSISDIEMGIQHALYDGITTEELHIAVIKSAIDLMDEDSVEYGQLASRLTSFKLRKDVFGKYTPPRYADYVTEMVKEGRYSKEFLDFYTQEELEYLGKFINHERDNDIPYSGFCQYIEKYLVQKRSSQNKEDKPRIYETPQLALMSIVAARKAFNEPQGRLEEIIEEYTALSMAEISYPTPIMGGLRTPTKQFSSCVVVEAGDSLDEINAATDAIVKYASQRAGLGINAGMIRAKGDPVRGGETAHTGIIPFIKYFESALKSCSQGGLRGASATLFYPMWHKEFEDLIVLKNNKGTEFTRARRLDYGVQVNELLFRKLRNNEDIYLYSPYDVEGLYEAFFSDPELFEHLYESNKHKAKKIPALAVWRMLINERGETSRIYIQDVDNTNQYGTFNKIKAPIKQSNLCLEITLPTKSLKDINDRTGLISLCTLAAMNLGKLSVVRDVAEKQIERIMRLLVNAIDEVLDYQDYPVPAAFEGTMRYRPLGIGVIDQAHWLAKRGYSYSGPEGNEELNWLFEAIAFYGYKASMERAKRFGACPGFEDTLMAEGIFPHTNFAPKLSKIIDTTPNFDWDSLAAEVKKYGMRNATITALMPSETSSQVSGATNGIEPPRHLVSVKASRDGYFKQAVPELYELKDKYELMWSNVSIRGYIEKVAIAQRWVCQAISANNSYNPQFYPDKRIPEKQIFTDIIYARELGVKTWYYQNVKDIDDEDETKPEVDDCESGACKI